jgi:hypothetical protein
MAAHPYNAHAPRPLTRSASRSPQNQERRKGRQDEEARASSIDAGTQTDDRFATLGSTRLSGIFLDGNENAPPHRRSGPDGDGSAKGESTEVEHIPEASEPDPSGQQLGQNACARLRRRARPRGGKGERAGHSQCEVWRGERLGWRRERRFRRGDFSFSAHPFWPARTHLL